MDNTNDVTPGSSPEEVVEETAPVVNEDVKIPTPSAPKTEEKVVPYSRFKEVNDELTQLKNQPKGAKTDKSLNVEDYIDISASLEGLDQKEKEKLAREHKLTGKPLSEIRQDEDYLLWQSAYRAKQEKEKALAPSGTQPESDMPLTVAQKLANAKTVAEKEKILTENGMYRSPKPKADRTNIGATRAF